MIGEVDQFKIERHDARNIFDEMKEDNKNLKVVIKNNCDKIVLLKEVSIKKDKVLDTILENIKLSKTI